MLGLQPVRKRASSVELPMMSRIEEIAPSARDRERNDDDLVMMI